MGGNVCARATQLDALLAGAIVAGAKRGRKGRGGPSVVALEPYWLCRTARAPGLKLIGPCGEEREKPLEPAVPLRHFVALFLGPG